MIGRNLCFNNFGYSPEGNRLSSGVVTALGEGRGALKII